MPETLKLALSRICEAFRSAADIFSIGPGELRYHPIQRHVTTTEEAWRKDWENIGKSFRAAVSQVMKDLGQGWNWAPRSELPPRQSIDRHFAHVGELLKSAEMRFLNEHPEIPRA